MKWPWQRPTPEASRLAFATVPGGLAWVLADDRTGRPLVRRCGLLPAGHGADEAQLMAALRHLDLSASEAMAVLDLPGYQLLQIDAPNVPPEELRAAARWRIREMLDGHVDEVTIDVLRVGQPRQGGNQPLFVVAARSESVQKLGQQARQLDWPLTVIDIADTTQRNLQAAAARKLDLAERACACLMRRGTQCLLTICVGDELYYSRRLDWDPTLVQRAAQPAQSPLSTAESASNELTWSLERPTEHRPDEHPRLLTELLRSFDVWERSWPDLPLAVLMVAADDDSAALAEHLQDELGLRVLPLDVLAGIDAPSFSALPAEVRSACAPLMGALLRESASRS